MWNNLVGIALLIAVALGAISLCSATALMAGPRPNRCAKVAGLMTPLRACGRVAMWSRTPVQPMFRKQQIDCLFAQRLR